MIHQLGDKTVIRDGHNWIADSAKVIGNIHLKNESSVWFGAVLRGDIEKITLGEGSNIQDNSVLHTDPGCPVNIGSGVTIGHLVMLHGCTIKDDSLIGIGAVALPSGILASGFTDQLKRRQAQYENELTKALQDGVISSSERNKLTKIAKDMNLSEEQIKTMEKKLKEVS